MVGLEHFIKLLTCGETQPSVLLLVLRGWTRDDEWKATEEKQNGVSDLDF